MTPLMEADEIKHLEAISLFRAISQVFRPHMSAKTVHKAYRLRW
jgi:hypothetical protein